MNIDMEPVRHTRQEWFTRAVRGLSKQKWVRSMRGDACAMEGRDRRRCALGHGIGSEEARRAIDLDGCPIEDLVSEGHLGVKHMSVKRATHFLTILQQAHDDSLSGQDMLTVFLYFGKQYRLKWPRDVQTKMVK